VVIAAWTCRFGYNAPKPLAADDAAELQKALAVFKTIQHDEAQEILMQNYVMTPLFDGVATLPDYLVDLVLAPGSPGPVKRAALQKLGNLKAKAQVDKIAGLNLPFSADSKDGELTKGILVSVQARLNAPAK